MSATAGTVLGMLPGQEATGDTIPGFGADTWWIIAIKVVGIFAILVVLTLFNIWFERRVVARMQQRIGPNRLGPQGLLQSLADGVKLALKEDVIPKAADKVVFVLAPIISTTAAFMAFAVIPLGGEVSIFGQVTRLQLTDMPVGVLYVLAVASVGVYGIVLAGWSSGSTYPLLGGLRSTAQVISYEVAMGLSFVAVFLYAGSMSTSQIVGAQADGTTVDVVGLTLTLPSWYVILLLPSFVIYLVSMVGETNRAPFDLPEAEGELVGGFHTEYSSLKFALFFLAEYVNMVTVSALATTLFLGGWRAPWPLSAVFGGALNTGWWPLLWFVVKVLLFMFFFIWLRGTLPRLRYDQFMKFGWKVLIPASLGWILVVAALRAARNQTLDVRPLLIGLAALCIVALVASIAVDSARGRRGRAGDAQESPAASPPGPADAFAGGHPVPPLPGAAGPPSWLRGEVADREPAEEARRA